MEAQNELIVWFTVIGVIFLFLIAYLYYGKKTRNPFERPLPAGMLFAIFAAAAVLTYTRLFASGLCNGSGLL